jgi:membrane-bound lytic murein transglycosylase D
VAEAHAAIGQSTQLARAAAMSNRVKTTYKVQRGDTLASVARLFKTTVSAIRTWNPRVPTAHLKAGDQLTVYTTHAARSTSN